MIRSKALLAFVTLGASTLLAAPPQPSKISDDAKAKAASEMVNVIIQYKQDPGSDQQDAIAHAGGSLNRTLHSIHANVARLPQSKLETLAADPNVSYISVDRPLAARGTSAICISVPEFTTEPINAPQAWQQGYIGTGVGVAVIDSGISPVDDLSTAGVGLFGALTKLLSPSYRIVYAESFVTG